MYLLPTRQSVAAAARSHPEHIQHGPAVPAPRPPRTGSASGALARYSAARAARRTDITLERGKAAVASRMANSVKVSHIHKASNSVKVFQIYKTRMANSVKVFHMYKSMVSNSANCSLPTHPKPAIAPNATGDIAGSMTRALPMHTSTQNPLHATGAAACSTTLHECSTSISLLYLTMFKPRATREASFWHTTDSLTHMPAAHCQQVHLHLSATQDCRTHLGYHVISTHRHSLDALPLTVQ